MNESHENNHFTMSIALGVVSGIAVQLLLAVLVAIIVGGLVSETAGGLAGGMVAVLVGLLAAFPLLRTLWMAANRIEALYLGEVADPLPPRWHFLLAGFVEYLNAVFERSSQPYEPVIGYVRKDSAQEILLSAVRMAAVGQAMLEPQSDASCTGRDLCFEEGLD